MQSLFSFSGCTQCRLGGHFLLLLIAQVWLVSASPSCPAALVLISFVSTLPLHPFLHYLFCLSTFFSCFLLISKISLPLPFVLFSTCSALVSLLTSFRDFWQSPCLILNTNLTQPWALISTSEPPSPQQSTFLVHL